MLAAKKQMKKKTSFLAALALGAGLAYSCVGQSSLVDKNSPVDGGCLGEDACNSAGPNYPSEFSGNGYSDNGQADSRETDDSPSSGGEDYPSGDGGYRLGDSQDAGTPINQTRQELQLHFPYVGSGNAAIIQLQDRQDTTTILADCSNSEAKNSVLTRYLENLVGENGSLDALVVSSELSSSIKGCFRVLQRFRVGSVYLNENAYNRVLSYETPEGEGREDSYKIFKELLLAHQNQECNGSFSAVQGGCLVERDSTFLHTGELSRRFLVPYDGETGYVHESRDDALLLQVNYGNESFLLAGSCSQAGYQRVRETLPEDGGLPDSFYAIQTLQSAGGLAGQDWLMEKVNNLIVTGDTAAQGNTASNYQCRDNLDATTQRLIQDYPEVTLWRTERCSIQGQDTETVNLKIAYDEQGVRIREVE